MKQERWRPLVNLILMLVYILGFFFAWTGLKLYALHHSDPLAALIGVAIGIFIWSILRFLSNRFSSEPN